MQGAFAGCRSCLPVAALLSAWWCSGASAAPDQQVAELARKGYFGAEIRLPKAEERAKFKLPAQGSVVIERVLPESPASAGGLCAATSCSH